MLAAQTYKQLELKQMTQELEMGGKGSQELLDRASVRLQRLHTPTSPS